MRRGSHVEQFRHNGTNVCGIGEIWIVEWIEEGEELGEGWG